MHVDEVPSRWSRRRAAVVALAALAGALLVAAGLGPVPAPAEAVPDRADAGGGSGTVRVGLVVDLGDGRVLDLPVTLDGPADGIAVLEAAGLAPAVRGFGGLGAAVCALTVDGTQLGCPIDSDCLVCAEPSYWVYFRAPAGASGFELSRVGAGAVEMRDGDVEGWRWGTGAPPRFRPFDAFFPPSVTTTVPSTSPRTTATTPPTTAPAVPTTAPPATAPTSVAPAPQGASAAPSSTTAAVPPPAPGTPAAPSTPAAPAAARGARRSADDPPAPSATVASGAAPGGARASGPPTVAAPETGTRAGWVFAAVAALLLIVVALGARRRRLTPAPERRS